MEEGTAGERAGVVSPHVERNGKRLEAEREELFKTIGHQQVVISWFQKLGVSEMPTKSYDRGRRRAFSVRPVSAVWAWRARPMAITKAARDEKNLKLMRRIDELYTADPTWGSRRDARSAAA